MVVRSCKADTGQLLLSIADGGFGHTYGSVAHNGDHHFEQNHPDIVLNLRQPLNLLLGVASDSLALIQQLFH